MGPSVEYLGYATEAFLACCVPYLQLECLILDLDEVATEFDADGDIVVVREVIVDQSL